jgi:hypothetical protein
MGVGDSGTCWKLERGRQKPTTPNAPYR